MQCSRLNWNYSSACIMKWTESKTNDIFCFFFHCTRLVDLWSRCYGSFRHGHATVHGCFLIIQDQRAVGASLKVIRTLGEKVD
ncbi:hypothetical protein Mapa_012830 [Marchantia paleacea]|nr:hypothetical protein Mapa_012830 [Marchantia paleacea]